MLTLDLLPYWVTHYFFNPTRTWPAGSVSSLSYNMARHELNGVAIEGPLENARVFGPADHVDRFSGVDLLYFSLGLRVESWEGTITNFRLIVDPAAKRVPRHQRWSPATLTISTGAGFSRLSRDTTEAEILRLFGAPFETDSDDDDRWHTFLVGGNFIDTHHAPTTGRLVEIDLGMTNDAAAAASSSTDGG